jgi:glycosyltransferase involved in cell wall biosynthesis
VKIIVFKARWGHMGEKSGFPLWEILRGVSSSLEVEELPVPKELPVPAPPSLLLRVLRKMGLLRPAHAAREGAEFGPLAGSPWATPRHQYSAKQALRWMKEDKEALALLPAAEDEFCADFAQAAVETKRRIFLCFHQPPAWFRLHWRRFEEFDALGGIFCVAQTQVDYFKSVTHIPVHLIRHGVRHDFFCPPADSSIRKGNRLLFVGQWLRDFETLSNSMPLIWKQRPDVHLDCVVPSFARKADPIRRLAMDERVAWHADLSDEGLKKLYQQADLLFLPVLDATANNAVLEAMASGLPVISTDVAGMAEYLLPGAGQLCYYRDADMHAASAIYWLAETSRRVEAGRLARNLAIQNFDWDKIGKQIVKNLRQ